MPCILTHHWVNGLKQASHCNHFKIIAAATTQRTIYIYGKMMYA